MSKGPAAANLSGSALNLEAIRADARAELIEILELHQGSKLLILDSALGNLLSHVMTNASTVFEEHGVTQIMELGMDINMVAKGGASMNFLHVLFFIRPTVDHCRIVASQILALQKLKVVVERFNVYFTPCKTLLCEQILEDEGVLDVVDFGEYELNLVPLEKDLLSLELEGSFRDLKLHGNSTSLQAVTDAVMKLQRFFGVIPNVKSIGPAGRDVAKMMCRAHMECPEGVGDVSAIDTMVLIDREVDLVSPLVTPLTYEGLIDELIGVKSSVIKVPRSILGEEEKDKSKPKPAEEPPLNPLVSLYLNSNDKLYAEIRGLNIEKLGPYLGSKAKVIRGQYDQFRANKDASITEIHDFVKLIPGLKENYNSLNIHINLTEELKRTTDGSAFRTRWNTERSLLEGEQAYDLIEDMIAMQQPPLQVLRLLCLQSLTDGGIPSHKFDLLRREIIQTYGFEYLHSLLNLETLGLARRREMKWLDSSSPFSVARKNMLLIDEDVNVMTPNDISFVSSGYAPLSVRLVQLASKEKGWLTLHSTLSLLPKPALEFTQHGPAPLDVKEAEANVSRGIPADPSTLFSKSSQVASKKVMVVFFIGGVSFMEVAAMRFLSQTPECNISVTPPPPSL